MNLVIDIGNTRTKFSVFEIEKEIFSEAADFCSIEIIRQIKTGFPAINQCILSATGQIPKGIPEECKTEFGRFFEFNSKVPLPFASEYQTMESIGPDRLAGIAGAQLLFPGQNVLIVSMGTAITYDLKTKNNIHKGGNIAPGLRMRFKSLHEFTHRLPLVEPADVSDIMGLSTNEAILNGVVLGILMEIEGYIGRFSSIYEDLTIILTGGDASFFEIKLKRTIFVVQNLVSQGLNSILNYNVSNN